MESVAKDLANHLHCGGPFPSGTLFQQYIMELVDILLDRAKIDECKFIIFIEEGRNTGKSGLSLSRANTSKTAYDAALAAELVVWDAGLMKKRKPSFASALGISSCVLDILKPRVVQDGKDKYSTDIIFFKSASEAGKILIHLLPFQKK